MSDIMTRAGPERAALAREVQGVFASDAQMQDAIGKLTLAGFDRAELSLPAAHLDAAHQTPETSAEVPTTPVDVQQARTLATSTAGVVGAMAAAGVTIATGGTAAIAAVAAAAIGGGAAGLVHLGGDAAGAAKMDEYDAAAARGELVLSVRTIDDDRRAAAIRLLMESGATQVADVTRDTAEVAPAAAAGVDSARWTG